LREYIVTDRDFILAPQTVAVSVSLEPVANALTTLLLLIDPEHVSGISDWVAQTAEQLPPKMQQVNQLLYHGLFEALEPDKSGDSFPEYLDMLESLDPSVWQERATGWMNEKPNSPGRDVLLADEEAFISYLADVHEEKGSEHNEAILREIYRYLNDPSAMKTLIVSHLRMLWDNYLKDDWERSRPVLQESVNAFQEMDYSGLTALEAVRAIAQRDMSGHWDEYLSDLKRLIFVPSVHIGPYVTSFCDCSKGMETGWIIFGARQPEGARTRSAALSRSELLVQLSGLADDVRLQMLELLVEHDELCAQDIMTMLNLSQSSASRHLRQLTATGFLVERRREVAKCYSLNPARIDSTLSALKRFLGR
jgi:DNA-binding transcriptional ArsR family regulator